MPHQLPAITPVTMDREEAEEVRRKWATPPEPEITPEPQLQTNYRIPQEN